MSILINCIIIFFARLTDVSIGTLRMIFVIKDKKLYSFIAAFLEITIWLLVARQILGDDTDIYAMIAYALGYASGTVVGGYLESLFAMGYTTVEMIIPTTKSEMIQKIRDNGFAVSVINCHGATSENLLLFMQVERKHQNELVTLLKKMDPDAFISATDVIDNRNGYFRAPDR